MNIFERAARKKLRFLTALGNLSVEQVFDLPVKGKTGVTDLDSIYRAIKRELKGYDEDSLATAKPDPKKEVLELQAEIVKYIADAKNVEAAEIADKAAKKVRRQKLAQALAEKQEGALASMTEDQLKAELAALGDD